MTALPKWHLFSNDPPPIPQSIFRADASKKRKKLCCSFCYTLVVTECKKEGIPIPSKDDHGIWSSHSLMNSARIVTCELLRRQKCQLCGATGDFSHTKKFCPLAKLPTSPTETYHLSQYEISPFHRQMF